MALHIDLWSDINCPFCYIGKRHLEVALRDLKLEDEVEIEWRSFELNPRENPPKGADPVKLLAEKYGRDEKWARDMNEQVAQMARMVGLDYHLDKMVPANSFNAHRLIQMAKKIDFSMQDRMVERLFVAKFTEGLDLSERSVLLRLGEEAGLHPDEVSEILRTDEFTEEVRRDEREATELRITGVPFFIFNRKISLSGARPIEDFKGAIHKTLQY